MKNLKSILVGVLLLQLFFSFNSCIKGDTGPAGPQGPAGTANVQVYKTEANSELTLQILIPTTFSSTNWKAVYSVRIPGLKTGDIIVVNGEATSRNATSVATAGIYDQIVLTSVTNGTPITSNSISIGVQKYQEIANTGVNYISLSNSGSYVCQSDLGDMFVTYCFNAASTAATTPYPSLDMRPNLGGLSIVVFKK